MSCIDANFGGLSGCKHLLKNMVGAVIQKKNSTWTDATIVSLAAWHTAIADDDSAVRTALPLPFLFFTNTTDEPTINSAPGTGKKYKDNNPIPSGVIYLNSNIEEYLQINNLKGSDFELIPFFDDGTFWATRKGDGKLKGFRVTLDANVGLPPEDKNNSFPVYTFFDSYREFENAVIVQDFNFSMDDLLNYVPVALKAWVKTPYATGTVTLKVVKIGSNAPFTTGAAAGDFPIRRSINATPTVVVTAVDVTGAALGEYVLTIKKDNDGTPANLDATDTVFLQVQDDDATYITYTSGEVKIVGG